MYHDFLLIDFPHAWIHLWREVRNHPVVAAGFGTAIYLTLVQFLRYRHVRTLNRKYGEASPQSLTEKTQKSGKRTRNLVAGRPDVKLTPEEAQEIILHAAQLEVPGPIRIGLIFAMIKTYAIPTISEILYRTKELSNTETVSKRFTDTGVLISTWLGSPFIDLSRMDLKVDEVDSRHAVAIARVNWLHSRWPIKNDDYIYTLSLFILEPIRWAKRYGWRELLPIEQEAYFVFWKEVGHRMKIQDIPETLQDMIEWSENYEETAMVPSESNYQVGQYTLNYVTSKIPDWFCLRDFMRKLFIAAFEPRVRIAFSLPEPSPMSQAVIYAVGAFFVIRNRYFSLPRFKPLEFIPRNVPAEKHKEKLPRFHPAWFDKAPWYKPEPKGLSKIWQDVLLTLGLLDEKYLPGPNYKSEGYRLEEIGPISLENEGHAEVMKMAAEIQKCPVTGIWAR